ncbi:conserved protein of unknown function [Xenorhabdus doucetiae]|uniref:Uncharacterized protein n=1 Tax=Xenorhabdus doucetiae TaxID=351671 RepID=A0A068QM23_9GAMM|nr:hypothetical protein LY16_01618 [Xenorhabdus doucetiae]CDG15862.1 conserved protein of unknown function [Xenorhabdus doucetiae]
MIFLRNEGPIMTKARLHDDAMVPLLREHPEFAQHYLHQALVDIDEEGGQEAFLIAVRHVVEASGYGGFF